MTKTDSCLSAVANRVEALAPEAKRLLLAVSGGADSVALFRSLLGTNYVIEVAHLDHALRDTSIRDFEFVKQLCLEHDVPFHSERIDVATIAKKNRWNLENAARRLRYSFLTHVAKEVEADVIATAHNQDDQAETVLMQMLRGAAFLQGMPARQKQVIRPMLSCSRMDIEAYLVGLEQAYVTDETNFDTNYSRAWLRQDVLPLLEKQYPAVKVKLSQLADIQREQGIHFDQDIPVDVGPVDVEELLKQDVAVQRHRIARLLARANLPISYDHLETIRLSLEDKNPKRISLAKDKQARLAYGQLEIIDKVKESVLLETIAISDKQSLEVALKQVNIQLDNFVIDVDLDKLFDFPNLILRSRAAGDRIQLSVGGKKLSDIFIDKKIVKEDRDSIYVIASAKEVLWVEGVCTDKRVQNLKTHSEYNEDKRFMQLALEQAQQASQLGELPVGAVLVYRGEVIAKAHNLTEQLHDPSAHAELLVLREGAKYLKDWRLSEATLYVTLEPCAMCFGAMLQAHLPNVVFAATNTLEGAHGGVTDLQQHAWKRKIMVKSGVLAQAAEDLLKDFFKSRRG